MKKKQRSLTVFFAGELFNLKHLIGNAYLAEAIYEKSHGKYLCALPQDFDPRGTAPRAVRDHHIRTLVDATWPSSTSTAPTSTAARSPSSCSRSSPTSRRSSCAATGAAPATGARPVESHG